MKINFNYSATSSRSTTAPQCQPKPEQLGFITPLSTCRDQDLHAEHWDVHFCQGKYIQLQTNERSKGLKYAQAWNAFQRSEDNEEALQILRHTNPARDGAPKVTSVEPSNRGPKRSSTALRQ